MFSVNRTTGNLLLDSVDDATFDALKSSLARVHLVKNVPLAEAGAEIDTVWFPTGAVLSVVTPMHDGQGVEACMIGPESAYGLLNALGAPMATDRVIAQVPGPALRLACAHLKGVSRQNAGLTDLLVRHIQAHVAQTHQTVACNALHKVEARLCRWLLMLLDRAGPVRLPLTQEFLSFMLGVSRTTVTGAARSLQAAGLIGYSRGHLEILDRGGLEEAACECYHATRERQGQLLGVPGGALKPL